MITRRLVGFIFVAFLLFQCTEEPPTPPFQGTAEDTARIKELMRGIDTMMTSAIVFTEGQKVADTLIFGAFYWEDTVSNHMLWQPELSVLMCSLRVKAHPYQFGRQITNNVPETTLVFGLDTTCTVYLDHTFDGSVLMQIDRLCSLWYLTANDSPDLDSFKFDTVDMAFSKNLFGTSRQAFHFDLTDTGWVFEKVSGITEFTPMIDSAISTNMLVINTDATTDTIEYSLPNPLEEPGKRAMNQLTPLDDFITVPVNQEITFEFHTNLTAELAVHAIYWRFYATMGDVRVPDSLVSKTYIGSCLVGSFPWTFNTTGRKYLTFEVLDANVGYYLGIAEEPDYSHYSTVWRVPIEVQ